MRKAWIATLSVLLASMGIGAAAAGMLARSARRVARGGEGPTSPRVVVEVINATTSRGLARRAEAVLRGAGFDVVALGTTRTLRETTVVVDHSNHPEWARRVASTLRGGGRSNPPVEERPDSSRYLDITVVLGANWRPPPESFDP